MFFLVLRYSVSLVCPCPTLSLPHVSPCPTFLSFFRLSFPFFSNSSSSNLYLQYTKQDIAVQYCLYCPYCPYTLSVHLTAHLRHVILFINLYFVSVYRNKIKELNIISCGVAGPTLRPRYSPNFQFTQIFFVAYYIRNYIFFQKL